MGDDLRKNLNEEKIDEEHPDHRKRNTWLIVCIIIIIVMMLPSTLAFLAIF
ncbi:MAG: hypothetical protein ACXAC5_07040 [Promethearchaeota archaeon]|jgi:hypothetical protein